MPKEIVSYTGLPDLSMILIGMVVGIAAACLIMLYQIRVPGKIIRALIRAGADAPEKALNAGQLGFKHEWLLAFALGENGAAANMWAFCPARCGAGGKRPARFCWTRGFIFCQRPSCVPLCGTTEKMQAG